MPNRSNLGLKIIGRIGDHHQPEAEREPVIYSVSGLSSEKDICIIGYAGRNYEGEKQWSLHWYRNAERVVTPDRTFDSPEDALAAAAEIP